MQFWNSYRIGKSVDFVNSLGDNSDEVISELQKSREYISTFGLDLNEIRSFLLLPTKDYNFEEVEMEEEDINSQIFALIAKLGESEANKEEFDASFASAKDYFGKTDFATYGLKLVNKEGEHDGDLIVFKLLDTKNADMQLLRLEIDTAGNLDLLTYSDTFELETVMELDAFLKDDLEELRGDVTKNNALRKELSEMVFPSAGVQAALKEKSLSLESEKEDSEKFFYEIKNKAGDLLDTIVINKKSNDVYAESGDIEEAGLQSEVVALLTSLDGRTENEKAVEEKIADLKNLFEEKAFKSALEESGLQMGAAEDSVEKIRYPLLNSKGTILKYIVIYKVSGEIKIEAPDGTSADLVSAIESVSAQKKTLDLPVSLASYEELSDLPSEFNVLIAGKHGSNVDTIMFANVDIDNHKISLLSIPRDLYYKGKKINSVYAEKGMTEFKNQLQEILGYKIHKYILVDMYAFRDIVDLIGGIDVTLEEDLIDPSYKACDNGVCSTLYYEAGTYHFNGTQALRVARSRHYSSDYSRAERQQLILEALKNEARELKLGDAGAIIGIIKTVLASTETDIDADEALLYYFRYQNFDLSRGNVLSTANVLEAIPVPVDYVTSRRITKCEDETKPETCKETYAIDTLSPREGNWDYIKWYVQSLLK